MTTAKDNEAFRLEFVGRMSAVLGIPEPEREPPILRTTPSLQKVPLAKAVASDRLLAAVSSAKLEIDQLRHIVDRYQQLAFEMSKPTETAMSSPRLVRQMRDVPSSPPIHRQAS